MRIRAALFLALLSLCACQPPEESQAKAIIGAILIDGRGGPPLSDSAVVIANGRILDAGPRITVSIHPQASRIDGSGKYIVPAFVDVCGRAEPAGMLRAATPEEARAAVERLAAAGVPAIYIRDLPPAAAQAAMEAARAAGLPVIAHIATQAEAQALVTAGASAFVGIMRDTQNLEPALVSRLRDLRITVAPALSALPPGSSQLAIASANTRALFAAGVPMAVASEGRDFVRECELLVAAGIPPLDTIVAATRNGAVALHQESRRGAIEPGKEAAILLLSANPGEDIRNLRRSVAF
jgi:imidazolonepropionase-like amidohydrolase